MSAPAASPVFWTYETCFDVVVALLFVVLFALLFALFTLWTDGSTAGNKPSMLDVQLDAPDESSKQDAISKTSTISRILFGAKKQESTCRAVSEAQVRLLEQSRTLAVAAAPNAKTDEEAIAALAAALELDEMCIAIVASEKPVASAKMKQVIMLTSKLEAMAAPKDRKRIQKLQQLLEKTTVAEEKTQQAAHAARSATTVPVLGDLSVKIKERAKAKLGGQDASNDEQKAGKLEARLRAAELEQKKHNEEQEKFNEMISARLLALEQGCFDERRLAFEALATQNMPSSASSSQLASTRAMTLLSRDFSYLLNFAAIGAEDCAGEAAGAAGKAVRETDRLIAVIKEAIKIDESAQKAIEAAKSVADGLKDKEKPAPRSALADTSNRII